MHCYYELLRMKAKAADPMGLIVQLTKLFNLLLQVKELNISGADDETIASRLGQSTGRVYHLKKQAALRSHKELVDVIKDCVRAQEDITRRGMNDRVTLEMLIIKHSAKP